MKITKISEQKRNHDRVSIYADNKYLLSLSVNQLLESRLRVGDEIDDDRVQKLGEDSELGKAFDRAYNYLSYRSRSEFELRTYLKRKQYEDEIIDKIMMSLISRKLVDDYQFARDWVESRQTVSPRSKRKLRVELSEKRINTLIIDEILSEVDQDESETVVELIMRKRLLSRYDSEEKLMRYLAGQGFAYGTIKAALERLDIEES